MNVVALNSESSTTAVRIGLARFHQWSSWFGSKQSRFGEIITPSGIDINGKSLVIGKNSVLCSRAGDGRVILRNRLAFDGSMRALTGA